MNPAIQTRLDSILKELSQVLDITKTQFDMAVQSYEHVAGWLAKEDSVIAEFNPEILPQGSFLLGTMIKPLNEDDELDIDLVCRLESKKSSWTQYNLKTIIGDRL